MITYYNEVLSKINLGNFKILKLSDVDIPNKMSIHIEALNYLIFEYLDDNKDPMDLEWEYVIIPNDCDFDFTTIPFDDFFKFIRKVKTDDSLLIDVKDIETIKIDAQINPKVEINEDKFWDEPIKTKIKIPTIKVNKPESVDDFWL
jgi:hypothetical protein